MEKEMMGRTIPYDPDKHAGLPLYQIVSTDTEVGIATGYELVTDKETIENAVKVPYFFKVKESDVKEKGTEGAS
jgi:hypothetical protein